MLRYINPSLFRANSPNDVNKTEHNIPPTCNNSKISFGSYCMRATNEILDKHGNKSFTVHGYDTNMDITERVSEACEVHRNSLNGSSTYTCTNTKLFFLKDIEKCNGEIFVIKEH